MTISKELEATLQLAIAEAKRRRHEYVTLEHLLYALCADPVASKVMGACGADCRKVLRELEELFSGLDRIPGKEPVEPKQTPTFWRVLQRAALHVQGAGRTVIDGKVVLISLLSERDSHAAFVLDQHGVTRLKALRYISHGSTTAPGPETSEETGIEPGSADPDTAKDPLAAYTVSLLERAARGQIDPLVGRTEELRRVVQVLCRRRKNNPILVGDPGVGKTAIVEGLALAVHEERVPEVLAGVKIYSLDMGAVLAGTRYRGDFEARLKGVIAAVQKDPKAILFIDEIHTIVGAGATSGGSMDASNLLKPALAAGELRCIGSTTFPEYKAAFERDRALGRRFQKIEILEPSIADTVKILVGLRPRYEEHHKVHYTDEALATAAELAARYVADRYLPDKAIDVLDEAGAERRLAPAGEEAIGSSAIEAVVARMARIPPKSVSTRDEEALANLESALKTVIFGQDQAISAVATAIRQSRAGLGAPERPIGSFLLSGPTGVGKTELARQLAQTLGVAFLRFDMTEYMEKHTVSRLIGAPPGYVGFDQGGLLTDAIRRTPHAVLLLDEIEKAHSDVWSILLQVMDHATLTDNNGRKADFRHVILMLTTNAGARELVQSTMGFASGTAPVSTKERTRAAIERTFSPEFRNRLDAWIAFEPLGPDAVAKVVDKLIAELGSQLAEKSVTVALSSEARTWFAERGFDAQFGARPMGRLIADKLKKPLSELILFGPLKTGGHVRVEIESDEPKLVLVR